MSVYRDLAGGQGAGLVENDGVHVVQGVQGRGALEQDPALPAAYMPERTATGLASLTAQEKSTVSTEAAGSSPGR
jgi:hypothetical protein